MKNPTPPNTVNTPDESEIFLDEIKLRMVGRAVGKKFTYSETDDIHFLFCAIDKLQYLNKTLQETNVSLQELSVKMEEELKAIKWNNDGLFAVAEELKSQLAAAKEENAKFREALQKVQDWSCCQLSNRIIVWDREVAPLIKTALSASEKEDV